MNHLKQIAARLEDLQLDAMLVTSEPGEYYALGFRGEGMLLVARTECYYVTDARYTEAAAAQITGTTIDAISSGRSHEMLVAEKMRQLGIRRLGFEESYMSVAQYQKLKAAFSGVELLPAGSLLGGLRASKDPEELAIMKCAQEITDRAFTEILNDIKPGVTEQELAARLTYLMMSMGASKNAFDPIVVSGPKTSLPHGVPGDRKIGTGEFVTMDYGALYQGYCADMTRTVAVGQPTDEMRLVYDTVAKAQLAGIAAARAGVSGRDIDGAARKIIADAGYGEYFSHSFGHSLGIEIHEDPGARATNPDPMPVGALISAEPGIYLPGRFGVRIEDTMYLTETGAEVLTRSPKQLIIL